MEHVAIMQKSWDLISKILSGEKTIESRWYRTRRAPWNKIKADDVVFFKNSGGAIIAKAVVSKILQFEIESLFDAQKIVKKYGRKICLVNPNPVQWPKIPKYCVLIGLKNPQTVESFQIDKKGFGVGTAWIIVEDVNKIRKGLTWS